ncbi:MAG: UDP-N-acetylmuramate dehydrogenase [Deltaproteobacteria bacterium]|nr:UDP-N-acetylmuramate dehydrogenase [Deltaproteobacteria bacterium]
MITEEQKKELRRHLAGFLTEEVPLALKTSYRVGGAAAFYLQPESLVELELVFRTLAELELEFLILGAGCNVLVVDEGVRSRVVISLDKGFGRLEIVGTDSWSVMLRAESGVRISELVRLSADKGCSGFEKLAGIPGTVGGALAMNAGAYGGTIYDSLAALQIMEKGELEWWRATALKPVYRDGGLRSEQVVVAAYFLLERRSSSGIISAIAEIKSLRQQRLPSGAHAGSVFKNPDGAFAGCLLDEAGCKGMRCGGACVSKEHANIIVADKGTQSDDVLTLMEKMRTLVRDRHGINLESEIRLFS